MAQDSSDQRIRLKMPKSIKQKAAAKQRSEQRAQAEKRNQELDSHLEAMKAADKKTVAAAMKATEEKAAEVAIVAAAEEKAAEEAIVAAAAMKAAEEKAVAVEKAAEEAAVFMSEHVERAKRAEEQAAAVEKAAEEAAVFMSEHVAEAKWTAAHDTIDSRIGEQAFALDAHNGFSKMCNFMCFHYLIMTGWFDGSDVMFGVFSEVFFRTLETLKYDNGTLRESNYEPVINTAYMSSGLEYSAICSAIDMWKLWDVTPDEQKQFFLDAWDTVDIPDVFGIFLNDGYHYVISACLEHCENVALVAERNFTLQQQTYADESMTVYVSVMDGSVLPYICAVEDFEPEWL